MHGWQGRTLAQLQVVGDLLQDHEAGQDEALRAADARAGAAMRLVPLAVLPHPQY